MKVDERCQLCGEEPETANHILFSCPLARRVWAEANVPMRQGGCHPVSIFLNFHYLLKLGGRQKSGIRRKMQVLPLAFNRDFGKIEMASFLKTRSMKPLKLCTNRLRTGEIGLRLSWWLTHV